MYSTALLVDFSTGLKKIKSFTETSLLTLPRSEHFQKGLFARQQETRKTVAQF